MVLEEDDHVIEGKKVRQSTESSHSSEPEKARAMCVLVTVMQDGGCEPLRLASS